MKFRHRKMIWGVLITVMLMTSTAYGQSGRMMFGKMGKNKDSALNLTDAQKDKINAIKDDYAPKIIDAQAELKKHQLSFKKLMDADKPNQRAINSAIDKGAKLRATIQKHHVGQQLETRAQLTPEQLKIMKSRGGRNWGKGMRSGYGQRRGINRSRGRFRHF